MKYLYNTIFLQLLDYYKKLETLETLNFQSLNVILEYAVQVRSPRLKS